ncbi:MAG: DUF420 domain-containing protein [Cyclobacteriaceae bacterium]|nr:DUF420 domain-containing protein [Cyclobacteriaceae bacterium]
MNEKRINRIIITLSIIIPVVVALLFNVKIVGVDLSFLPPIYATINGITGVLLIIAVIAIKNGKRLAHERIIKVNLLLSSSFLIMYIMYHTTSEPTIYAGHGSMKYIYYFVLLSHILLSVLVVPLVLFTLSKTLTRQFDKHKKLARITFPIWLYVAFSGVIVYLMISPFYV